LHRLHRARNTYAESTIGNYRVESAETRLLGLALHLDFKRRLAKGDTNAFMHRSWLRGPPATACGLANGRVMTKRIGVKLAPRLLWLLYRLLRDARR